MSGAGDLSWRRTGRTAPDEAIDFRWRAAARRATLGADERVRIARGVPQAVIRILSYRSGRDAVARTAAYVTAKADERFVIEGDVEVAGADERLVIIGEWAADFAERRHSRDAVHIELSAPPGSPRAALVGAARAFADETFGATHRYLLAEHRDTAHPHVHLVVKLRGYDGRQLDPRKADLARWRERFASRARDAGLELACSPRAARGLPPARAARTSGAERAGAAVLRAERHGPDADIER